MQSDHHHEPAEPLNLALDRANALLLVIDVQERLFKAMPEGAQAPLVKNLEILIKAARRLAIPVVTSEQYPKGLGPTLPALRELIPEAPLEKLEFSCGGNKAIARKILQSGRKQIIVRAWRPTSASIRLCATSRAAASPSSSRKTRSFLARRKIARLASRSATRQAPS